MTKRNGDFCWTEHQQIFVPDVRLVGPLPAQGIYEWLPLRGYATHVAVRSRVNGTVVGWFPMDESVIKPSGEILPLEVFLRTEGILTPK